MENDGDRLRAGKAEQFLKSQFSQDFAALSPDGRWLAYTGDESGREEVYVRTFGASASGQGGKWQISNGGGEDAVWSRNEHELLYFSGDQIMTASYSVKRNTFLADKPRPWAAKARVGQDAVCDSCFDLSPDGKRMAVLTPVEAPEVGKADHEVALLFNFFGELRRRAPTGK